MRLLGLWSLSLPQTPSKLSPFPSHVCLAPPLHAQNCSPNFAPIVHPRHLPLSLISPILTLGLLRGLDDKPVEAPLTDRDLWKRKLLEVRAICEEGQRLGRVMSYTLQIHFSELSAGGSNAYGSSQQNQKGQQRESTSANPSIKKRF